MHPANPSRGTPDTRGINLYTDGSKNNQRNNQQQSGAGVVIAINGQIALDYEGNQKIYDYHLSEKTSVFQSKVFAVKMATAT